MKRVLGSVALSLLLSLAFVPQAVAGEDCGKSCCKNAKKAQTEQTEKADMKGGCAMCAGKGKGGKACAGKGGAGHGKMGGHAELMQKIHSLVDNHESITRTVEKVEGGVVTETRTTDLSLVPTLQQHVRQMYELLESGGSIRHWDPLFVEIFEHADKIEMDMEMLEDGIRVRESSKDPYVAKLIQAHAEKVNEFVERGRDAMHEPTAVPGE